MRDSHSNVAMLVALAALGAENPFAHPFAPVRHTGVTRKLRMTKLRAERRAARRQQKLSRRINRG